ncbi:hypothetical protein B296_00021991 [Ensete ventricosum]|uniref:Uncharacterized protein n=1 Tax=Ensete ventricosum TaxID=4639 RepID=A0A427AAH5_ENSVE|nr:hypothetical protein B296_00021991 [Ensete ventricosum]
MCTTPIQVTSSQLIANEIFPPSVVKTLLYPGAVAQGLITTSMALPSWSGLLDMYNLTEAKNASPTVDLHRLEVLAGSYFSVAGALVGLINPGRMTLFGTLLIVWGLVKEGVLGKAANADPTQAVYVYPTILVALVCAFSTIKYNGNKAMVRGQAASIAKPLKSSAKSKLK